MKIEVWELWIKEPPLCLLSFDKGKTWENKKVPIFPFNYYPNGIFGGESDANYIFRKSKKVAQKNKEG